jgi:hypothetical protein
MKIVLLIASLLTVCSVTMAGRVSGTVTDNKGNQLAYASILVKGTTRGTTANNEGKYFLQLEPGTYTIVAQYVGYDRQEKQVTVTTEGITLDFTLSLQQLALKEVVIRPGGEDPAYEIIRNAIKKRPYYLNQLDQFQCDVYVKGQLRLRDYPKKLFGQEVDFEDGDTSKKKMVYLSETVAKYSVQKPNKTKIEVLSTKVSGQSGGFGFSQPQVINFYENNIELGQNMSSRGFVSPIANNALNFYRYKFEGNFIEDGKEINRIKVIPKRKYEPVFSGYINITEGDWRIHSVQLTLTKEAQIKFIDTFRVEQLYVPLEKDVWVIKTQVVYLAIKLLGFDSYGTFVNLYSGFDIQPAFTKKTFNSTVIKFLDGSNRKPADYWDTVRPVPLQADELRDYQKKDSLEQARRDPRYLDSLDRKRNKIKPLSILFFGQTFNKEKRRSSISIAPVIQSAGFNTVEGWYLNLNGTWFKRLDTLGGRRSISFTPYVRYGFSNGHLNVSGIFNYTFGKKYFTNFSIAGGKRVYQFNSNNPITPFSNTFQTLLFERNYAKLYEAWYGRIYYAKGMGGGLTMSGSVQYQDRIPLENTTEQTFFNKKDRVFTPNYPVELMAQNIERHQAVVAQLNVTWRPGSRYIEFPDRVMNMGSRYPTFYANFWQGIDKLLGSDVSFSRWRFGINDNLNLKLWGSFRYNVLMGGFLNKDKVQVPDYIHFNGNQVFAATSYLSGFQILPYYKYSHTNNMYYEGHVEHHFNGMLTNKIPLFRRLNWNLVGGMNAFYVNKNAYYSEVFAGLENIFNLLRLDLVWGFEKNRAAAIGLRLGISGVASAGQGD